MILQLSHLLVLICVIRNPHQIVAEVGVKESQLQHSWAYTSEKDNALKVKRDIRLPEHLTEPPLIRYNAMSISVPGQQRSYPFVSSPYITGETGEDDKEIEAIVHDVRLHANRTPAIIYGPSIPKFAPTSKTELPLIRYNAMLTSVPGQQRIHSPFVSPPYITDQSGEDDKEIDASVDDVRLPANRTPATIYGPNIPKFTSTVKTSQSGPDFVYPPFVEINEQFLEEFESFVKDLEVTLPSEQDEGDSVPVKNCIGYKCQRLNTTSIQIAPTRNSGIEVHRRNMLDSGNSQFINFGIDQNPSETEEATTGHLDSGPRLLFLSGFAKLFAAQALLSKDNAVTSTLSDTTKGVQHPSPSNLAGEKNTFYIQDMNSVIDEDQIKRVRDTSQVSMCALQRCGVFPACTLKVSSKHQSQGNCNVETQQLNIEVACDSTYVSVIVSAGIILSVVIIISNFLIIVVTLRTKNLRRPHGYFKISLALADLVNGAFVLPNVCSNLTQDIWFDNRDIVQIEHIRRNEPNYSEASFFGICAVMSHVVSVYSVLLLSVDSFLSVRWPMKYRVGDLMTARRATALVITVWIFSLTVSALPLLARDYITFGLSYATFSYLPVVAPLSQHMSNDDAHIARYVHVIVYAVFVWAIPFLSTWILTLLTAFYSRGMLRSMSTARKRSRQFSRTIGRLERDMMRTVSIVLTLLTITVMPMLVAMLTILVTIDNNALCLEQYVATLLFAGYYILACGSFVNVIVYNACHKEFRRSMFDFICDLVTFLFARCFPTYCDMQAVKSSHRRRRIASARGTTRTTLDPRRTRNSSHPSAIVSQGVRSSGLQTSIKSNTLQTPHCHKRSDQSSCKSPMENASPGRTFSTVSVTSSARDNCLSTSSAISPYNFRKLIRNQSSNLSDVFLPSPGDTTPTEPNFRKCLPEKCNQK